MHGKAKELGRIDKGKFKLFDFFGNYEYFEDKFSMTRYLKLPQRTAKANSWY